jgi:DNA-binding XRE family transcriptional regulator
MIDERRLYQALGRRVRKLREKRTGARGRMTQAELAELVGLERTSITNIERGNQKVPLHVLFRICEAVEAPLADVLPTLAEAQTEQSEQRLEDVSLRGQTVQATPLVKQAVLSVLKRGN